MTATYIALATITLTSTDSEIVFSSIPATYRDLVLVANYGSTNSSAGLSQVQFNSDTAGNYNDVFMTNRTDTGATVSLSNSGATAIRLLRNEFDWNTLSLACTMQVMDYSATNKHKTVLIRNGSAAQSQTIATAARWANTNAINTLRVFTNDSFRSGSTFSLYGIN